MFMQIGYDQQILKTAEGVAFGLALGSDFTTEHECGIGPLQAILHIVSEEDGIEGRRIAPREGVQKWEDTGDEGLLTIGFQGGLENLKKQTLCFPSRGDQSLIGAWSDRMLGVRAKGEALTVLRQIVSGMADGDVAVTLAAPGEGRGLKLILIHLYPTDLNEVWIERERNDEKRRKEWDDSGIVQELRKADKSWFSLGGTLISSAEGTLKAWLNPQEQGKYHCGYFTLEELRAWARNEGPVIRVPKEIPW